MSPHLSTFDRYLPFSKDFALWVVVIGVVGGGGLNIGIQRQLKALGPVCGNIEMQNGI